jgi:hypothetical protein
VLEFDADCTAVVEMLVQIGSGYRLPFSASPFTANQTDRLRFALLATHLMFRAMAEDGEDDVNWMQIHAHMPPELRFQFLRHSVGNILAKLSARPIEDVEVEIVNPVADAVEKSAMLLTGSSEVTERMSVLFAETVEFQRDLLRRWSIVRPELEKHKLGTHELSQVQPM